MKNSFKDCSQSRNRIKQIFRIKEISEFEILELYCVFP